MANFDIIVNAVDKTKGTFQGIERSLKGIQGLAQNVGAALAGAFTVKSVVDAASAYQKLQTSITGAVGAARGTQLFNQLNTQANTLGVAVDDLAGAFKNLKSTGLDTSASSLEAWTKLAAASGTTVENIADAVGNAYQGSFGKISKATNDLIEVENKYGQFVVRIGGQVKATVANTGQVVNVLKQYVDANQNYTDALKVQATSIDATYKRLNNAISSGFQQSGLDKSIAGFIQKFVDLENQSGAITKTFTYLAKGLEFVADNFKLIGAAIAAIGIVALGSRFVALAKYIYEIALASNKWLAGLASGKGSLIAFTGFVTAAGKEITYFSAIVKTLQNAGTFIASVFGRATSTFGGFAGAVVAAVATVGIFGNTLLKLGGIALRFLGGPWGLLIAGVLTFKDEIADAGRKVLEFFGILEKKPTTGNLTGLYNFADTAGGGRGRMGGPTYEELLAAGKASTPGATGPGKPADTYLADLIGNFGKARSEFNQLMAAMKNTKDINLLAKLFDEASSRAEQFGIVLEKDAALIQRAYALAVKTTTEELRQQEIQLANETVTTQKFKNELQATNLQIYEQSLRLMDAGIMSKKFQQEIAQTNLTLMENKMRLADLQIQTDIFIQELQQSAQGLQQQELRLGMAAQMAQKFAQELQGSALALRENGLRLADANYQQELFNQSLTGNQQAIQQQKITLELLNKAFADGSIGLQEYAALLGNIDARLIGVTETTRKALDAANATVKSQDNSTGAVKDLTAQLRAGAISWRQYENAVKNLDSDGVAKSFINVTREIERAKSMAEVFAETLDVSVRKAGDTLANSLTDGIVKGKLSLNSFKDFFGSILNDIAAMIVKKQFVSPIVDALTGAMSGGGSGGSILSSIAAAAGKGSGFSLGGISDFFSGGFSGLSDWFGGFFADGGYLPSGKVGIAGEAGPELITGPANIVPMDKMGGGNQPTPIVNFTINAIDTQTGVEFLMKNKPQIIGMVQQGFNSQGKRGIYR